MAHQIHGVTGVEQVGDFTLRVAFPDGTSQTIDFSHILTGEIYGPLADPGYFRQVRVDPESHTIVWPNGPEL